MRQPSAGGAGWPFPQAPLKPDVTKCHRDKLSRLATGGKGGRSARLLREGGLPSRFISKSLSEGDRGNARVRGSFFSGGKTLAIL